MKDEIKEILEFKENADYKKLSCDEVTILKDYITNLQQRIEKAVEYIKVECMCNYGLDDTYMEKLLNILNGKE